MRLPPRVIIKLALLLVFISTGLALFQLTSLSQAHSASPNIVISEIQIAGATANDEFVELYNPTNFAVEMNGWRLARRTSSATGTLTNLVSNLSGTISAHGYFLIANPEYTGATTPDTWYSATTNGIAANNTVILYSDAGQTVVDKVGMGTAEDNESFATVVPNSSSSIERKASSTSTSESLMVGGLEELAGNGYDSDNNQVDFTTRTNPDPQNSLDVEPVLSPTPLPTSTPLPTTTPTVAPTNTPTPTVVAPTTTPTLFPTNSPTPLPTPVSTISPTPSPTPTTGPKSQHFAIQCSTKHKVIHTPIGSIAFPLISCKIVRI
jgi:hypothetical protein